MVAPEPDASWSNGVDPARRIYCNRELSLENIEAVGFDLDYTLAEYIPETFDVLAYDGAIRKLLAMGYPEEIKDFTYDHTAYQRGIIIDKKRGNLVKLDRHKYVKVAYHGLKIIPSEERKAIYAKNFETAPAFTAPDFASVDTAFLLVDVCLFCQLVDLKDRRPDAIPHSYAQIYKHVRRAVDLCHCDGEIKDPVAVDPGKYILPSPELSKMLTQLRSGGTKVFLLTNSLFDYTEVVCKFLLGPDWLDNFDFAICGARKPSFLLDPFLPIFQVNTKDGSLSNIELGSDERAMKTLAEGKVFQGGNWNHLHRLLQLSTGSNLLYVGDHMYSDILRSKRTLGWRTILIVPELFDEMNLGRGMVALGEEIEELQARRAALDAEVLDLQMEALAAKSSDKDEGGESQINGRLLALREKQLGISDELAKVTAQRQRGYHPAWGQLFKAGSQNSRWGQQVQDYACLYTSHATNLLYVAPDTSFRVLSDQMPHDRV